MIERVDDAGDARIALYAHVGRPAWLREAGLFVAEGRLVVRRLIESGRFPIESIVVTPAALESFGDLRPRLQNSAIPVRVCPPATLQSLTGFDFHRGCLALARRPAEDIPFAAVLEAQQLLALEGIGNPDNVGGLFRVAAAFAVGGVILDPTTADPLYRKAVRTSMGASLCVPFWRARSWPGALDEARAAGFAIVATTPGKDAEDLGSFAPPAGRKLLVAVGAEGSGLTDALLAMADYRVRIPIDPRSDSLNVSVAAGIVLHAVTRS